jgi:heme O synthase-like polyprenyltransferase
MDSRFWKNIVAFVLVILIVVVLCNLLSFVFKIIMCVVAVLLAAGMIAYIIDFFKKKQNG